MNDIIVPENKPVVNRNADDLSRVVGKALAQIESILDMDENEIEEEKNRMKLLSVKKDASIGLINAGLKADENRFRRENKDIIERLFAKVQKQDRIVDGTITRKE